MMAVTLPKLEHKTVGKVEEISCDYKEFNWTISNFFKSSTTENFQFYNSPAFSFKDDSFSLCLLPNWNTSSLIKLTLQRNMEREYSVEYNVSLKNMNDNVTQLLSGIIKGKEKFKSFSSLVNNAELLRYKSKTFHFEYLTIYCELKTRTLYRPRNLSDKISKLISLNKLSGNFKDLFGDQKTCDTTLKIKDKDYVAHRFVLIARSSVFAAFFNNDTLEKQTGVIKIEDCDPDSFKDFLEYLYCGKLEEISVNSALNLYYISDKYDVQELKEFCVEYLLQHLSEENICDIAVFADKYDEMDLFSEVQEFFTENAFSILLTTEWDNMLKKDYRLANKLLKEMSKVKADESD